MSIPCCARKSHPWEIKHVILGAGPVGTSAAASLLKRGITVVLVSRARPSLLPEGASHVALDVGDTVAVSRVCDGAAVVYQCLNAPYHRWREVFPGLQRAAVAVAQKVGARYVSFENVYMYGAPGPTPFVETQAHAPCSHKGRVRAEMVDDLRRLRDSGQLDVTHVRASDLFGPGMRASALGDEIVGRAVAGRGARGFGDLDAPHRGRSRTTRARRSPPRDCRRLRRDASGTCHPTYRAHSARSSPSCRGSSVATSPSRRHRPGSCGSWGCSDRRRRR